MIEGIGRYPLIYIDNNKRKYKVMLLQYILCTPEFTVGYIVITAVQDYPKICITNSFIISIEVYSDILTGGYAVTTVIYI